MFADKTWMRVVARRGIDDPSSTVNLQCATDLPIVLEEWKRAGYLLPQHQSPISKSEKSIQTWQPWPPKPHLMIKPLLSFLLSSNKNSIQSSNWFRTPQFCINMIHLIRDTDRFKIVPVWWCNSRMWSQTRKTSGSTRRKRRSPLVSTVSGQIARMDSVWDG